MSTQIPAPAFSAADLWANHRARIVASAVVLASLLLLFLTRNTVGLLLSIPLLIGCIPPLAESDGITAGIDRWSGSFQRIHARGQQGTGKFARWFLRPLGAGSLAMWRLSERLADPHARAGVRLGSVLLLWSLMIGLLLMAIYIIVALVIFGIIMSIVGHFLGWNDNSRSYDYDDDQPSPLPLARGKRLVTQGLFFNTPTGTRVDENGRVLKEGLFFDTPTGTKINADGRIVEEGLIFDTPTGKRINDRGQLVEEGLFFDTPTGTRINSNGEVVKEGLFFDESTGLKYE